MTQTELSLFIVLLGSVAGYLLRIVQKFEERRDEIFLKFLPAFNYNIYFFRESVDFFLTILNFQVLRIKLERLVMTWPSKFSQGIFYS